MLDIRQVRQSRQLVVRQVDVLEVLVTPDALQGGEGLVIYVQLQVGVPRVVEGLTQA